MLIGDHPDDIERLRGLASEIAEEIASSEKEFCEILTSVQNIGVRISNIEGDNAALSGAAIAVMSAADVILDMVGCYPQYDADAPNETRENFVIFGFAEASLNSIIRLADAVFERIEHVAPSQLGVIQQDFDEIRQRVDKFVGKDEPKSRSL